MCARQPLLPPVLRNERAGPPEHPPRSPPPARAQYTGPPHPPPNASGPAACGLPWEAPFAPEYRGGRGALRLTQCNWYLPQGPGVPAVQRFLWQVQVRAARGAVGCGTRV